MPLLRRGLSGLLGGSSLWSLADLGVSGFWIDAQAPSTFTLAGSEISQVTNKLDPSQLFSEATSSLRPTYTTTGFNSGYSSMLFDGLDDRLTASFNTTSVGLETFILVAHVTNTSLDNTICSDLNSVGSLYNIRSRSGAVLDWTVTGFGDGVDGNRGLNNGGIGTPAIIIGRRSLSLNTIQIYRNGTLGKSTTITTSDVNASRLFRLGMRPNAGASAESHYKGYISELFVSQTYISDTDLTKAFGYAAHKWGLQAGLPSNHLYKNAPP